MTIPAARFDPTDPGTIPEVIRAEALSAAMLAVEDFLELRGIVLDATARLELLDIALADAAARYEPVTMMNLRTDAGGRVCERRPSRP